MNKTIIADAGPLIAFGKIKRLNLLTEVLGTVIITEYVFGECLSNPAQKGAKEIHEAINKKLITLYKNPEPSELKDLFNVLGAGEASAIVLASQLNAGILIDERLGRKVAQTLNLSVIGTAGILLRAKEQKLIKRVYPIILELKECGYYLSIELIKTVSPNT